MGIHKQECQCYERPKPKTGGSKSLAHTGLSGGRDTSNECVTRCVTRCLETQLVTQNQKYF